MGPWAGLGMDLGWAYNLKISTGSGRAWAEKFQIIWIGRGSHLYSINAINHLKFMPIVLYIHITFK